MTIWRFEESGVDYGQLMTGEYDISIVILSVLIACGAGYTALIVADRINRIEKVGLKFAWLVVGAVAMGMGIWAMHFTGMLALTMDMPIGYSLPVTILSGIPAIIGSALTLLLLRTKSVTWQRNQVSAFCLATCIALMHFTGMEAMRMPSILKYDVFYFVMSIVVAHLLASCALYIKYLEFNETSIYKQYQNIISAIVIGLSVSGMHYTAMGATRLYATDVLPSHESLVSNTTLIFSVISIVTLLLIIVITVAYVDKRIRATLLTTRIDAKEKLRESDERFRASFTDATVGMALISLDYRIIEANQSFYKMLGYAKEKLVGILINDITYPDDVNTSIDQHHKLITGEIDRYQFEKRYIHAQGFEIWALLSVSLVRDKDAIPLYTIAQVQNITQRKQAERDLENRTNELMLNQKVLLQLAKENFPDQETAFNKIIKTDSEQLKIERVSVWLFNHTHTEIVCKALCDQGEIRNEELILRAINYPRYFQALEEKGYISANDAHKDPSTSEFSENYLTPLGITSMMDTPIRTQGEIVGIVCHEHIGPKRKWTVEDEDFANSISDLCALAIESSKRKRVEEELRESSETKFRNIVEGSLQGIFVHRNFKPLFANQRCADIFGYNNPEAILELDSILEVFWAPDEQERIRDYYTKRIAGDEAPNSYECRGMRKDGSNIWFENYVTTIDWQGETAIQSAIIDITDRKQVDEQLTFQASHDALTGLVNRREFERRVERLLATVKQDKSEHALCFMDLDQFKVVNDTCGHTAGDEMLRQISSVLKETVRQRDTLARLGGDEFGVLMEHCTLDDANRVTTSLLTAVQNYQFVWHEHTFKIGASIGLVPITESTINQTELLKQADAACYVAKDAGRNRIHMYRDDDTKMAQRHGEMQWVERINKALDEDRFCLYAQTIVRTDGSTDKHYELLLRMIDEKGEIIPPMAFLPAAERYNLISKIDQWVIKNAFGLLAKNPVFLKQIIFCSINLSGQSLTNPEILKFIITQLHESGIQGEKICFEITETAAISNMSAAIKFISTIRGLGCQFSLDDFGSGLSSFGYLKNLEVDYLKIDGMFVKDIVDDPIDRAMVKSINEIGHVMGMKTIAEFVENDVIKGMLKEIGVDYAQGYGIGRPQPLDELLDRSNNVTDIKSTGRSGMS